MARPDPSTRANCALARDDNLKNINTAELCSAWTAEGGRPHMDSATPIRLHMASLAAAAGAAAAHAFVATAVADHDGAADVAGGGVAEVDDSG